MSNEVKEPEIVFEETKKPMEERLLEAFIAKLSDGTMESVLEKYAEKAISEAMSDTFKGYGDGLGKLIEQKFKEVLSPMIEKYNFSEHLVKMESVLDEVLQQAAKPHKEILDSFKKLMTAPSDEIQTSELFEHYTKFVAKTFDTSDREIDFDGGDPEYEPVEVEMYFEETSDSYSWSNTKYAQLIFQVSDGISDEEELKKLNFIVPLMKFDDRKEDYWIIRHMGPVEIKDLRYMNEFEVLLRSMNQMYTHIKIDTESESDTVYSESKPEPNWE